MKTLTTIGVSSAFSRKNTNRPSYLMTGLRRQQEAEIVASFPGPGLNTDVDLLIQTVGRSRAASNLGDPLEPMNLHVSCRQETSHTQSPILSRLPTSESLVRQPLGWHSFVSFLWWVNPSSSFPFSWFLPLASWLFLPLHFCSLLDVPNIQCRWTWCSLGWFAIIQHEIPCWIEFSGAAALWAVRCFLYKWLHRVTCRLRSAQLVARGVVTCSEKHVQWQTHTVTNILANLFPSPLLASWPWQPEKSSQVPEGWLMMSDLLCPIQREWAPARGSWENI